MEDSVPTQTPDAPAAARKLPMKIVIADRLPSSAAALLRAEGWAVLERAGRPAETLAADLADAEGLIVRSATKVTADVLAAAPRLRVVARAGTGVDNVDLDAASARGVLVLNAPGANSVSVAEHACALMLALARSVARADAQMKAGVWDKAGLRGAELRGKTLGVVGVGRIGRELIRRAAAFDMNVVAYDPFIAEQVAADLGVALVTLDDLCAQSDFISLHLPSTDATRGLVGREFLARCRRGVRILNTARGDLVDEAALIEALEAGQAGGAGLDVFQGEPTPDRALTGLPQVIATPHIAASTAEAQELVGVDAATSVREFLRSGIVRNAVNYPSVAPEEVKRLQPYVRLAERLGGILGQLARGRPHTVALRYYGALADGSTEMLAGASLVGLFRHVLSSEATLVNARTVAAQRGLEVIESRSSRPRNFTGLLSLKLHTSAGELWAEGAVFEPDSPRLMRLDDVEVEVPLEGTLIVIRNDDRPGVIGEIGSILGRHGINIAAFALGRGAAGAVGVVRVESHLAQAQEVEIGAAVIEEIQRVPAVSSAAVVRL